jgi:5-methylcytosine-specific restriction endonuclease McrA
VSISKDRKRRIRDKLKEFFSKCSTSNDVENVIKALNPLILGWRNYYGPIINNANDLKFIDRKVFWKMIKWLMKKFRMSKREVFRSPFYRSGKVVRRKQRKGERKNKTIGVSEDNCIRFASAAIPRVRHEPWNFKNPYRKEEMGGNYNEFSTWNLPSIEKEVGWTGQNETGRNGQSRIKELTLARDNHKCVVCGRGKENRVELSIHHLIPIKAFPPGKKHKAHRLSNCASLCWPVCHKKAQSIPANRFWSWVEQERRQRRKARGKYQKDFSLILQTCSFRKRKQEHQNIKIQILTEDGKDVSTKISIIEDAKTKHECDYLALIEGLKVARSKRPEKLTIRLHNQVVVNQITGKWKTKSLNLLPLLVKALEGLSKFAKWIIQTDP